MFRNCLAAALRNMARDRIHTAIGVVGLAIAFAAVLVITLFVRNELTYDSQIQGYERIYRISLIGESGAGAPLRVDLGNAALAARLRASVPEVEAVARLKSTVMGIGHDDVEYNEELVWADPDFFSLLPLRVRSGDLRTALEEPDSVVITRSVARKYFGSEDVIGRTLSIRRSRTLTVTAVLDDLPSNTHLSAGVFASGHASFSALTIFDARPPVPRELRAEVYTYLRVKPGVSRAALESALERFGETYPIEMAGSSYSLHAVPLGRIHLEPAGLGAMKPSGNPEALGAMSAVGALILVMAMINFVNLTTARSVRRAVEVGVRKAAGAGRMHLAMQFIGEALLHSLVGVLLAVALVELCLPYLNALLDWNIEFRYIENLGFLLALLAAAVVTGVLAAVYPACVLTAFRPRTVLYGRARSAESKLLRQLLVTLQFAILTGLLFTTFVIHRQADFALNQLSDVPTDRLVMIRTDCSDVLRQEVLNLPGVQSAACSALSLQPISISSMQFRAPGGARLSLRMTAVDEGLFELFGATPLAGRFPSRERVADRFPAVYGNNESWFAYDGPAPPPGAAVINATAARQLGMGTPESVLGSILRMEGEGGRAVFQVIGVVPDFPIDSIREPVQPTIYYLAPEHFGLLSARLSGRALPETLAAIGRLWKQFGDPRPMDLVFYDQYLAQLNRDITRQAGASTAFCFVALVIACLGLFGLSVSIAQQRTREIGIRKALGADTGHVLAVLLWQFSKPVLWATVIAWPVATLLMQRWLQGFAYRIDVPPWLFPVCAAGALLVALFTVSLHCVRVARARPVQALRYE